MCKICTPRTLQLSSSYKYCFTIFFFYGACSPIAGYGLLILEVFRDHTQQHNTVGRTPLDEWSVRRRDLYLTTHNTHNRQTSMPQAGFEPTVSAGERPQTYALDRAATGTGYCFIIIASFYDLRNCHTYQCESFKWCNFYVRILLYPWVLSGVKIDIRATVSQTDFITFVKTCYMFRSYGPFPHAFSTCLQSSK